MLVLTDVVYSGPEEFCRNNYPKTISERLLEVEWFSSIYDDDFFHSYEPISLQYGL